MFRIEWYTEIILIVVFPTRVDSIICNGISNAMQTLNLESLRLIYLTVSAQYFCADWIPGAWVLDNRALAADLTNLVLIVLPAGSNALYSLIMVKRVGRGLKFGRRATRLQKMMLR